jgi:hypothetical protein
LRDPKTLKQKSSDWMGDLILTITKVVARYASVMVVDP